MADVQSTGSHVPGRQAPTTRKARHQAQDADIVPVITLTLEEKTAHGSRHTHPPAVNKVDEDVSSDEDEVYTFFLSTETSKDQPLFKMKVQSGASINILDEKQYHKIPNCSKQCEDLSLPIKGSPFFPWKIQYHTRVRDKEAQQHVLQGSGGCLLNWKTSREQVVQQVKDLAQKTK